MTLEQAIRHLELYIGEADPLEYECITDITLEARETLPKWEYEEFMEPIFEGRAPLFNRALKSIQSIGDIQ